VAEHEEPNPLLTAGWQQGVLFDAPDASYALNIVAPEGDIAQGEVRTVRTRERLVIISHACDITSNDEKYIEALICRKYDPNAEILGRWDQNSPRYFIVDPAEAFVADASHRLKISKNLLATLTHDDLAMDELRFYRFVQWLTRRYDRPTVPDDIYERFHRPVYSALGELAGTRTELFELFNAETNEIRVVLPEGLEPPYSLGMIYLTLPALTPEQLESINGIHRVIAEAAGEHVYVAEAPVIFELDEAPFGVMRRTQPFIIEYPSMENESAALPSWLSVRRIGYFS